jgi:hypothetical protein
VIGVGRISTTSGPTQTTQIAKTGGKLIQMNRQSTTEGRQITSKGRQSVAANNAPKLPPLPGFAGVEINDSVLTVRHKKTDVSRLRSKSSTSSSHKNNATERLDVSVIKVYDGTTLDENGKLKLPKLADLSFKSEQRGRSSSPPVTRFSETARPGGEGGGDVSRKSVARYGNLNLIYTRIIYILTPIIPFI